MDYHQKQETKTEGANEAPSEPRLKGQWLGTAPGDCDLCQCDITDTFIDGRTKDGHWAFMCPPCHARVGVGLGNGKGQKYEKDNKQVNANVKVDRWIKIAG